MDQASLPKSNVPALMTDQFRKSVFGLLAYLLVSNMSVMKNLPTVSTKRFSVYDCANRLTSASTFCVSPPPMRPRTVPEDRGNPIKPRPTPEMKGDGEAGKAYIAAAKEINPNIAEQFDHSERGRISINGWNILAPFSAFKRWIG